MTYNVGDHVSWNGDRGEVLVPREGGLIMVWFDDGTYGLYHETELEAAE